MNYFNDVTVLPAVQGTSVVAAGVLGGGTVDWSPNYEPRMGFALATGTVLAGASSITGYVQQSDDGVTWGTLAGTVVSAAGTLAQNQVYYGTNTITKRYVRGQYVAAGAGGTVTASMVFLAKPRVVD
jgi:hypothetical protein